MDDDDDDEEEEEEEEEEEITQHSPKQVVGLGHRFGPKIKGRGASLNLPLHCFSSV